MSPSHFTFPNNFRISPWALLRTSIRNASSTTALFVVAPLNCIASVISASSISMLVLIRHLYV
jgi:hypothetical protein